MPVIQVTFNPAIWTAGSGAGTSPGNNGYNAYTVVNDPDGVTAWAFEYFGAGFARFNLSNGSIVHQDSMRGTPGFSDFWYNREDGTSMFVPDDQGHYYTVPNLNGDPFGTKTLYKSHVGAGTLGTVWNGYMVNDATLDLHPLFFDGGGLPIEGWNSPISPAADGNRYLALTSDYIGSGIVDVGSMTIKGKFTLNFQSAGNWFNIGSITNIGLTGTPSSGTVTVTGTFSNITAGDFVSFTGITDPNTAFLNGISIQLASASGTTLVSVLTSFPFPNPVVPSSIATTGTVYISFGGVKSWTTFQDKFGDIWIMYSVGGAFGYPDNTSLNDGIYLIRWHPQDGVSAPGPFSLTAQTVTTGGISEYDGTITGGAGNAYAGYDFTITGFSNAGNNGSFRCVASTSTALFLQNSSGAINEVTAATATSIPKLITTVNFVSAATLGTGTNGIEFAGYVPANHSVFLGNSISDTGQAVNIDLTAFTQNAFHADDLQFFYNGTFDAPEFALDVGVQPDATLGIVGSALPALNFSLGGILNIINPTTLTSLQTYDLTNLITTAGYAAGGTFSDFHYPGQFPESPIGTMAYSSTAAKTVVAYEFIGSAVYIVPTPPPVALPTVTTQAESSVSSTTATANGNITNLGGAANCTLEGFVFDTVTHALPGNVAPGSSSYAFNVTSAGTFTTGPFATPMTGLTASTTYFVRAVTQNSAGYSYGGEISFVTTSAALNHSVTLLQSSLSPSHFEDEVTFTATVSDPVVGDTNPATAPLGTVQFVADGSFGFGSVSLIPLSAHITAVSATTAIATYTATNSFAPGERVTVVGFGGAFTQFNGTNLVIATATSSQFTVSGSYTTQAHAVQFGTATSTNASQATASTTVLIPGIHTVVAFYLGDPTPITGHGLSQSQTLTQQVTPVASVSGTNVELPGFALEALYSTLGDASLPSQATLAAVPSTALAHQSINLLWYTLNVAFVRITGNNHVDYQSPPPPGSLLGFDTGFLSTSGSGIYVVGNGFTTNVTLVLQAYDQTQTPIGGLSSSVAIIIT